MAISGFRSVCLTRSALLRFSDILDIDVCFEGYSRPIFDQPI